MPSPLASSILQAFNRFMGRVVSREDGKYRADLANAIGDSVSAYAGPGGLGGGTGVAADSTVVWDDTRSQYQEITRFANRVAGVVHWTTPSMTQRFREVSVNRDGPGGAVLSVVKRQYDEDGVLLSTMTATFTRDQMTGRISSVTRIAS